MTDKRTPKCVVLTRSPHGGAGKAALRFHQNLQKNNIDSQFIHEGLINSSLRRFVYKLKTAIFRKSFRPDPNYYFFDNGSYLANETDIEERIQGIPTAIFLFWMSGFVSMDAVLRLQKKFGAKVFWYLVDMAPFTGGCHYAWDCHGYITTCGTCPALRSNNPKDKSWRIWNLKDKAISRMDLHLIAPTKQVTEQVRDSGLFRQKPVTHIPFGIDEQVYDSRDRAKLRRKYNIAEDSIVLFCGAASLEERRKGMHLFVDAMALIKEQNLDKLFVIIAGGSKDVHQKISVPYMYLPYIKGEEPLIELYTAADLVVVPSVEDTSPLMVMESLMCGTPVSAFPIGIARDMIVDGENGYLASKMDAVSLSAKISQFYHLELGQREKMRVAARSSAKQKFSQSVQYAEIAKLLNIKT